jgi:chaperonin cofactor prefoldin
MTPEDIAQITTIVAAAEERITARLDGQIAAAEQRITGRLERTMEALTANLSEVRQELSERLDTLDRRTERTEINVNAILMQLSGISRSLTVG